MTAFLNAPLSLSVFSALSLPVLLALQLVISGCNFYSSAGRKQFEEKAPAQVQARLQGQAYAFLGCQSVDAAQAKANKEVPVLGTEVLETNQDYQIFGRVNGLKNFEVKVVTFLENGAAENCNYEFSSRQSWRDERLEFLNEVAKRNQDLD